jgi:hypothetical protein
MKESASSAELREMDIWKSIWEDRQERIVGLENFVASLSGVDGIVVLSTGCRLLGFGGEIIAAHPELVEVSQARDANASTLIPVPAEAFDTRHRSAFRLCANLEDCVVLIVSQDGEAKAVKRVGNDVVLWKDVDL